MTKKQLCTKSSSVFNVKIKDHGMKYPLSLGCNDKRSCPFKNRVYVSDLSVLAGLASVMLHSSDMTWGWTVGEGACHRAHAYFICVYVVM